MIPLCCIIINTCTRENWVICISPIAMSNMNIHVYTNRSNKGEWKKNRIKTLLSAVTWMMCVHAYVYMTSICIYRYAAICSEPTSLCVSKWMQNEYKWIQIEIHLVVRIKFINFIQTSPYTPIICIYIFSIYTFDLCLCETMY